MRELKFRAWHKYKGLSLPFKLGDHPEWPDESTFPYWQTLTVKEQYTGLHDASGAEIYEGDIIRDDYYYRPLLVEWIESGFWTRRDDGTLALPRFPTVIGNIHENPELVEVTG